MVVADFLPSNRTRAADPPSLGGVRMVPAWLRIRGHFVLAASVSLNLWPAFQLNEGVLGRCGSALR